MNFQQKRLAEFEYMDIDFIALLVPTLQHMPKRSTIPDYSENTLVVQYLWCRDLAVQRDLTTDENLSITKTCPFDVSIQNFNSNLQRTSSDWKIKHLIHY